MSLIVDKYRVDVVMELCTKYGVREGKVSFNVCVGVGVWLCVCSLKVCYVFMKSDIN